MVDQADIKPTNGRNGNGRGELPPRAVARSTGEFLHDIASGSHAHTRVDAFMNVDAQRFLDKGQNTVFGKAIPGG